MAKFRKYCPKCGKFESTSTSEVGPCPECGTELACEVFEPEKIEKVKKKTK